MKRARGYDVAGRKRIVLSLEADTFSTIAALAADQKTSFNEAACTVLEWGIESGQQNRVPDGAADRA
jgi:hypothetical protein